MPTLATTNPTLADLAARMQNDGSIDPNIVEILTQTNEILDDMTVIEANSPTEHTTTIRSGLPSGTWRQLNYGVQPEKSRTVKVKDSMGMLESYAEVDKKLADLNGNSAAWRLSEDRAFIEGMNQSMAETLFYGDITVHPERFTGLSARYNSKSAENSKNIVDAKGTNGLNHASIWLLVWSPNTLHTIYPKGLVAGLKHKDLGEHTLDDGNGGLYQGYRSHYSWDIGLVLRDWRYAVRIANIDTASFGTSGAPNLLKLMAQAVHRVPNLRLGRPAFYMNRETIEELDIQSMDATKGLALKTQELEGQFWQTFRGIPIRTVDALLSTEAQVQ